MKRTPETPLPWPLTAVPPVTEDARFAVRYRGRKTMTEKSFAEKIIAGLLAIGAVELEQHQRKYRALHIPGKRTIFFVGKKGALRYGQTAVTSFSAGNPQLKTRFYMEVIAAGESQISAGRLKEILEKGVK